MPEKIMEICREFNRILGSFEGKESFSQLDTLRNRIIGDMEIVTAYTDCFQITNMCSIEWSGDSVRNREPRSSGRNVLSSPDGNLISRIG